jgi:hypothetical protein
MILLVEEVGEDDPPPIDLRKNHGKEESRAKDLFYALWIPDRLCVLHRHLPDSSH